MTEALTPEVSLAPAGPSRRAVLAGGAALTAATALGGVWPARAEGAAQPNIIYILADDLGWKDVGFQGSDIPTPNLDRLAAEGARLGQFYAQPMCTPTRAALMTGRYPLRYGLQTGVIPSGGTYGLDTDEYLLPEALRDAGYATALVGKWHLGHADTKYWPRQRGFDSFYGALVGEIDHFTHSSHGVPDWYRDDTPVSEAGYDNTLFGQEAARVISTRDPAKPLFLYLAFTAPHSPYQAPDDYVARVAHIADPQRRLYAAMIAVMDDEIGRVLAALQAAGIRDNTIIVFHSDNGGVRSALFAGESKVEGALPADNGPYRDGKGTTYEGGTRVVALLNWPARIAPGEVSGMIHVTDMLPTLAGLAGAPLSASKPLDGMDVWATISAGAPSPRRRVVYNVDPMGGTLREDDMKLVWTAALPPRVELFDIAADPGEATDIVESQPELVSRLQEGIIDLARGMAPPLLMMEAIRLTFGAPPVAADPATLYGQLGTEAPGRPTHIDRRARLRQSSAMLIFKVFRAPEWAEMVENGRTPGAPVDRADGYIHFSTAHQLPETLRRHFAGETGLVLLAMKVAGTAPWLRWEPSRGGDLFPHLYRDLEIGDVVWSRPLADDPAERALPLEPTCA